MYPSRFSWKALSSMDMSKVMSWVGFLMLARSFVPPEIATIIQQCWALFWKPYTSLFCAFHIHEQKESGEMNHLFSLMESYLEVSGVSKEADQVVLTTQDAREKDVHYKLEGRESVEDRFKGVTVWWCLSSTRYSRQSSQFDDDGGEVSSSFKKGLVLKMHKKDKQFVMTEYLDHVVWEAEEIKRQKRALRLFATAGGAWRSYLFKHPATFDTLAMRPELKASIIADLDKFRQSEAYFRRVGRAWKRGYLMYGPPGTGKSSLIAAMANYLKYDVYDLELTKVNTNEHLKFLFRSTNSKSIVVIEDIDCSLYFAENRNTRPPARNDPDRRSRERTVTLSGLLNSTDGLCSCVKNEQIIIFTTNHLEKLDPALIRPGRMDMHIHMSYCSFESFKELASRYFSINAHPCYDAIRRLMEEEGALITPAQATGHMFGRQGPLSVSASLHSLIAELRTLIPARSRD